MQELFNYSSGYQPIYSGYQPQMPQVFNMTTVMGNNPMAMMLNMLVQPQLMSFMNKMGMVPGSFQPAGNMIDMMQGRSFFQAQQQAMSAGSERDRRIQGELINNLMRAFDIKPEGKEAFTNQATANLATMAPFMAMMAPDTWDALHGVRGSATGMGMHVASAGRFMRDPMTGERGLSGQAAGQMTQAMYERLYGDDANIRDMRGIGATRAGQIFDVLAQRGMLPEMSEQERNRALMGFKRVDASGRVQTIDDLLKEKNNDISAVMADPEVNAHVRGYTAIRAADKIKEMAGSYSAMQEIFSEAGIQNVSAGDLTNSLNAIMQGQLHTTSGQDTEMTVRRMQALQTTTRMGVDQQMRVMAQGAALAQQQGFNPVLGTKTAQSAITFGDVFGRQAGPQGFGGLSKEEALALDQQLRTTAAVSPMANQMAAVLSMQEQGLIKEGTSGAALAEAIKNRQTKFTFEGKEVDITRMRPKEIISALTQSGVSASTASTFMRSREANQEVIARHNLQDFTRQMQGDVEVSRMMRMSLSQGMGGILKAGGMTDAQRKKVMPAASEAVKQALYDMPAELRASSDPAVVQERNKFIAEKLKQVKGMEKLSDQQLNEIAATSFQNLQQRIKRDPRLSKFKNVAGLVAMTDKKLLAETERQMGETDFEAKLRQTTGGLFQASPLRRITEALIQGKDLKGVIMNALGGKDAKEIAEAMAPVFEQIHGTEDELRKLNREIAGASPERKQQIQKEMEEKFNSLQTSMGGGDQKKMKVIVAGYQHQRGEDISENELIRKAMANPDELRNMGIDPQEVIKSAGLVRMTHASGLMQSGQQIQQPQPGLPPGQQPGSQPNPQTNPQSDQPQPQPQPQPGQQRPRQPTLTGTAAKIGNQIYQYGKSLFGSNEDQAQQPQDSDKTQTDQAGTQTLDGRQIASKDIIQTPSGPVAKITYTDGSTDIKNMSDTTETPGPNIEPNKQGSIAAMPDDRERQQTQWADKKPGFRWEDDQAQTDTNKPDSKDGTTQTQDKPDVYIKGQGDINTDKGTIRRTEYSDNSVKIEKFKDKPDSKDGTIQKQDNNYYRDGSKLVESENKNKTLEWRSGSNNKITSKLNELFSPQESKLQTDKDLNKNEESKDLNKNEERESLEFTYSEDESDKYNKEQLKTNKISKDEYLNKTLDIKRKYRDKFISSTKRDTGFEDNSKSTKEKAEKALEDERKSNVENRASKISSDSKTQEALRFVSGDRTATVNELTEAVYKALEKRDREGKTTPDKEGKPAGKQEIYGTLVLREDGRYDIYATANQQGMVPPS